MGFNTAGLTVALAVVAAIGPAESAAGESTPALDFELGLTAQRPAAATALTLHTLYKNPSDPDGKPSPLRKSVVEAPPGTVFDGYAIPACTASDDQLMASGASACPQGSQVGTGTVSLITGFGPPIDPFNIDAVLFNRGDGIVELFSEHRTGARVAVGHARFTGPSTLTETPAPNPGGPPDGESAVHQVDFHFSELRGPGGKPFITTPPSCPATRAWTSRITATVADGHTYTATSTTPCNTATARPPMATRPPAIGVRIVPSRVRAGRRSRVRVRLHAIAPRCVRGATVQLNRARTRSDAHGRATLVARLPRAGIYPVTATKRGCQAGRASVIATGR